MPLFIVYLLKVSVSMAVVYLFYHFILRKLTFYNHNRLYLLGYTFISFLIPFINVSPVLEKNDWISSEVITWVPVIYSASVQEPVVTSANFNVLDLLPFVLAAGILIMLIRLGIQLISFRKLLKKATPIHTEGLKVYQVDENIIPFSFGNSIFINQSLHNQEELKEIIRHEFVHVRQKHSLDILWAEFLCLVNWFNPFAWLLKKAIRQNLEFIADRKVIEKGTNKKEYQYLLLKVLGNHQYSIATQFNFSSLKKRIAMMNKLKSTKLNLLRFLFVLPLFAIILLSFRKQLGDTTHHRYSPEMYREVVRVDTVPEVTSPNSKGYIINVKDKNGECELVIKDRNGNEVKRLLLTEWNKDEEKYVALYGKIPPPPASPVSPTLPAKADLPENVKRINVNNDVATVWLKNGGKERYNLKDNNAKQVFEKKYGHLPPPPPPVPPVPPVKASGKNSVKVIGDFEISDKRAVVKNADGTTEVYDLTNVSEKKKFENKYGKLYSVATNGGNGGTATLVYDGAGSGQSVIAPVSHAGKEDVIVVDEFSPTIAGQEDILITITRYTSKEELNGLISKMKEKGIDLTFDEIEYNDKGILVNVSGKLKTKDGGHSNFVAVDFTKLVVSVIKKGERTYFKVSTTDRKEVV